MTEFLIPPEVLRPASVLLVHRRGWIGTAIRWVTWSGWNHAALIEGARHGDAVLTIEAHDLDGVRHCSLDDYLRDPAVRGLAIYERPGLTIQQTRIILEWAEARNGASYDALQLLGIYLRCRIPWIGRDGNRLDACDRMICSELVGRAFDAAGVNVCPPGVGLGCLTPADLTRTLTLVWETWR